ncbi:hypothetical protein AV926_11030 [Myroides marinus]|uniref:DUF4421 domain-containing protein n=1 Tax=Myroides marinus TaxID=703342 RepID=A0A165RWX6_9FLAO|nr:DUF4421 family protein [Myroides marinus]KUF43778.1 hypothetical protein AS361_16425 [Myroides marinus]KZE79707.1 hypothetical protein AV926_11030 [Myroides marinus]
MRNFLIIVFVFCSVLGFAQVDSLYVKEHKQPYGVKIAFGKDILALDYTLEDGKNKQTYQSNKPTSIGLGFLWRSSSLSFSYGFSFMRDKEKGKTKATDFQYHYYGDKFLIDLYYKRNKGFYSYTNDTKENIPSDDNIFPDFKIHMYGGLFQYVWNSEKYSLGAAYDFNKTQVKSAGSLLLGGGVFYSSLRNIPVASDAIDDYDKKTYHFGPNIGYGYNWVPFKKVLVAGAITLGVNGAIEENLLTRKTVFIVNPSVLGRFSIGYIGENWIVSASTLSNGLYLNFKETYQSSLLTSTFSFTVIKRFKLKKEIPFLQKDYDWKEAIFGKKNNELVSDIE